MPADFVNALTAVADHLIQQASEDAELRAKLRQLAQAVLEATDLPEPEVSAAAVNQSPAAVEARDIPTIAGNGDQATTPGPATVIRDETVEPSQPLPELTLGQSPPPVEPAAPSSAARWTATNDADFPLIEARCRLKAEGARWAATRRRLIAEGTTFSTEIEPMDLDIIARAKAIPDCFLWMCHPSGPSPSDVRQWDDVAGCFEAVADVVALLKQIQDEPDLNQDQFEQSLDLLAEAQSALRMSVATIDGPTDPDQVQIFNWLKVTASEQQIFIRRYMRVDDPAEPSQWADLLSRIEAADSWIQEIRGRAKQRRKLLGKVRHKLSLIADAPDGAPEQWEILVSTVDELVSDGMPPSNRELREMLVPVIDSLPELSDLPAGFQLVLREIDRFMATCPPPAATSSTQWTPEVEAVAELLRDRSMVLIGGDRRPGSQQAIKNAFKLRDLIWIETREHQSNEGFEPYVARPDVAVVMLAIRWASHSFGDVRDICERHGKPFVRLPAGYNPNQVAAQIMAQCSERLKVE
jgi:hypothetical protein